MGEQRQLHPRETMDDITEVSSTASIERKNTFMITKSTEARSKTVFSTIIGGVIGLLICLMLAPIIGITFGVVFILIGLVAAPFLMVGQVKDRTQQVRWKRLQEIAEPEHRRRGFLPQFESARASKQSEGDVDTVSASTQMQPSLPVRMKARRNMLFIVLLVVLMTVVVLPSQAFAMVENDGGASAPACATTTSTQVDYTTCLPSGRWGSNVGSITSRIEPSSGILGFIANVPALIGHTTRTPCRTC